MTRPRTRIRLRIVAACAAALTLTAPLSGCLVTDNGTDVGDLRDGSAQQALDDAANAVDDARQDVADAFDRAQEEVGGSFGEVGDDLTSMFEKLEGSLDSLSQAPEVLDEAFGSGTALSAAERVVIEDAHGGGTLTRVLRIRSARAGRGYVRGVLVRQLEDRATNPGDPEFTLRLWQRETRKAGQNAEDLQVYEALAITCYRDSNVIELSVPRSASRWTSSSPTRTSPRSAPSPDGTAGRIPPAGQNRTEAERDGPTLRPAGIRIQGRARPSPAGIRIHGTGPPPRRRASGYGSGPRAPGARTASAW